jgi:methylglutaconyl-CoA hydratase
VSDGGGTLIEIDDVDRGVTSITLNRPAKRNALSIDLLEQLHRAVSAASADVYRRVLVLRGNGPAFCAGLDLAEASDRQYSDRSARALANVYRAIVESPLVTIAAVHGAVMGGGIGLMAACDLPIAADDTRIAFPEVHRGLVAALVAVLVKRQIADRALRELVLLGRAIDANQAKSIGLVSRVTTTDRLRSETHDVAMQVIKGAPGAIARTKRLLDELSPRPITSELDRALQYHLEARDATEAAEGIAAFLTKREPNWQPRRA